MSQAKCTCAPHWDGPQGECQACVVRERQEREDAACLREYALERAGLTENEAHELARYAGHDEYS